MSALRPWTLSRLRSVYYWTIALAVLGARLWAIKGFGVRQPFMDAFGELYLYSKILHHNWWDALTLTFQPNNEHVILITQWVNIGLFLINHEKWDPLAQACVNAFVTAAASLAILHLVPLRSPRWWILAGLLAVVFLGPPVAWETVIWGFQSEHYLFILSSLLAFGWMIFRPAGSRYWWFGLVAAVIACLTLGSGFFTPAAVAVTTGIQLLRPEFRRPERLVTLVVSSLLALAAARFLIHLVPNSPYAAHDFWQFTQAFVRELAFPNIRPEYIWAALVTWLPAALLAVGIIRSRKCPMALDYLLLTGLAWVGAIDLTLAYARGTYIPYARYYEYHSVGVVLNGFALLRLLGKRIRLRGGIFLGVWIAFSVIGQYELTFQSLSFQLPKFHNNLHRQQLAVRSFLDTPINEILRHPDVAEYHPFNDPGFPALLLNRDTVTALPNEALPAKYRSKRWRLLTLWTKITLGFGPFVFILSVLGAGATGTVTILRIQKRHSRYLMSRVPEPTRKVFS